MSGDDRVDPAQIKRGDLIMVQDMLATVASDVYEVISGGEDSTAIPCVNVVFTHTGIIWTVKIDQIKKVGREFP
jgi:hypothetical protein